MRSLGRARDWGSVGLLVWLCVACSDAESDTESDAGSDAGSGAESDAGSDAGSGAEELLDVIPETVDPGTGPWRLVPRDDVREVCGLDPDLLEAADAEIGQDWAVIRFGELCHQHFPLGEDTPTELYSTTKTLGSTFIGVVAYQTRDLVRDGPKTGPLSDWDRVDHWLGRPPYNHDAHIAHVLAMEAHNRDLAYGEKLFQYDNTGSTQINTLSRIAQAAIAQDAARFGEDLDEFLQTFLLQPLGMMGSVWSGGATGKNFATSWDSTLDDMGRLGLLLMNRGVWNGERVLAEGWVYKMTHPAFEDGNTGYGYLTWLNGVTAPDEENETCAPVARWNEYPHGLSKAQDCGTTDGGCEQELDVGRWNASGLGGQYIVGHPGLQLVIVAKDYEAGPAGLWDAVRPALLAVDDTFDSEADFCRAYGNNEYGPDFVPYRYDPSQDLPGMD